MLRIIRVNRILQNRSDLSLETYVCLSILTFSTWILISLHISLHSLDSFPRFFRSSRLLRLSVLLFQVDRNVISRAKLVIPLTSRWRLGAWWIQVHVLAHFGIVDQILISRSIHTSVVVQVLDQFEVWSLTGDSTFNVMFEDMSHSKHPVESCIMVVELLIAEDANHLRRRR